MAGLTKEELEKRLNKYRKSMGFEPENQRFHEFLKINIDIDPYFILNLPKKLEVKEIIENKKNNC